MTEKASIRLYALGGCGTNIVSEYIGKQAELGFAQFKPCIIDASKSNLTSHLVSKLKEDDIYILEGMDGNGKHRASGHAEISKNMKQIILKFKPEQFNIVVFSASGGTGSVAGPLLVRELISQGHPTIALVVGSEESRITIDNTVKTLQSLDSISRSLHHPLVLSFTQNSEEHSRAKNDDFVRMMISSLSVLMSGENTELDTTDITNFINVQKVTQVTEGLLFLYVTSKEEDLKRVTYPVSCAALLSNQGDNIHNVSPEYACVGYPINQDILQGTDLYFVTSQDEVNTTFKTLQKRRDEYDERALARPRVESILGNTSPTSDDGMVF